VAIIKDLFDHYPGLTVFQTAGRGNEESLQTAYNRALSPKEISRVHVMGYTTELHRYSAAADVVITRAGPIPWLSWRCSRKLALWYRIRF